MTFQLVPARLTALLILLWSGSHEARVRGFRTLLKDRGQTDSPNAGWPMAAIAGALNVELFKPGQYVLGAGLEPCESGALRRAVHVCGRTMDTFGLTLVCLLVGIEVALTWN